MPHEIELKFTVTPKAMRQLAQSTWFKALSEKPPRRENLVSVYYDTAKSKLHGKDISLRVRRVGNRYLQTVKAAQTAGPFACSEWENEIEDNKPNLGLAKGSALRPLLTKKLKRELEPVFETRVARTAIQTRLSGSIVEFALDQGKLKTGRRSASIREIELELKQGDPSAVVALAEELSKRTPLNYEARSKAERGYALARGKGAEPACAEEITLDPDGGVADSFRAIGFSCLRHVSLNKATVQTGDGEGVHQMRVGLRRLRAAMSLFKDLLQNQETEQLGTELKWLTEQLGPARDLDVFMRERVDPMQQEKCRTRELPALKAALEKKRAKGFQRAKRAVESERYRELILRTALWLSGGQWLRNDDDLLAARRDQAIAGFISEVLSARTKKIVMHVKTLEQLNAQRRHKLRIAIKKLRYATEFFASLWTGKRAKTYRKEFGRALKVLQDALGKLNDITVHQRLAESVVHGPSGNSKKSRETAFAIGLVAGREQSDVRRVIADAMDAGKRLGKSPRFWTAP